jgi:hypothetical protein
MVVWGQCKGGYFERKTTTDIETYIRILSSRASEILRHQPFPPHLYRHNFLRFFHHAVARYYSFSMASQLTHQPSVPTFQPRRRSESRQSSDGTKLQLLFGIPISTQGHKHLFPILSVGFFGMIAAEGWMDWSYRRLPFSLCTFVFFFLLFFFPSFISFYDNFGNLSCFFNRPEPQ